MKQKHGFYQNYEVYINKLNKISTEQVNTLRYKTMTTRTEIKNITLFMTILNPMNVDYNIHLLLMTKVLGYIFFPCENMLLQQTI